MSSVSFSSNKPELTKKEPELMQELEAIRAFNGSLREYLKHLQTFNNNLNAVNATTKKLNKVNSQWIDTLNNMK